MDAATTEAAALPGATATVCALILAAGRAARFGGTENKVFTTLAGRPLLSWTLQAFADCAEVDSIILVGSPGELARLTELGEVWGGGKLRAVVVGGRDRQASVRNGLAACHAFDFVAVHDGARPGITPEKVSEVIAAAQLYGAATLALPVADTLIRGIAGENTPTYGDRVPRDGLCAVQTPQVFRTSLLRSAHDHAANAQYQGTDDASLVAHYGHAVRLVPGSPENLKVTRPDDATLASAILTTRHPATPLPSAPTHYALPPTHYPRIGYGYDVHVFAPGRRLFLGGVEFEGAEQGLLGHSDADVVLHALCDALLGAVGRDDIGKLFPPSDMRHKDRRSTEFLDEVKALLDADDYEIINIDITILAETPKINPKADAMKAAIAVHLGISPKQIGIKATTNEGMGFIGRGEGIAAHAIASVV